MDKSPYQPPLDPHQQAVLYKQLVISLKFHHRDTLAKLPRDLALRAINEVWESCQKGNQRKQRNRDRYL